MIAQLYAVEKSARINPSAWFRDVLIRIADHPITKLDELMPHNWAPAKS
jgi:transposase